MSEDKTLKDCNFCRFANELTEEIPYWSKKRENYSPYPKMVSCDENYSLKNEDLKEKEPELDDNALSVKLTLKDTKDKWVFYWATNVQEDTHVILPPESAYGDYENHGLKKCNSKGEVVLKFNQPQPYKDEKKTYCRHVHYLVEDDDQTWLPLKSIRVICAIPIAYLDERVKGKDCLLVNALPREYYEKEKIPNSVNLPTQSLKKLTSKSKERQIMKFLRSSLKEYPKLNDLVKSKKLDIKDVPIITYCAHSKCNASEHLIDFFYECGFNNTLEWKDGMEGWNKKRTFFEPEPEVEEQEQEVEEEPEVEVKIKEKVKVKEKDKVKKDDEDDEDDGDDGDCGIENNNDNGLLLNDDGEEDDNLIPDFDYTDTNYDYKENKIKNKDKIKQIDVITKISYKDKSKVILNELDLDNNTY